MERAEMLAELRGADYILLGEVHDNAIHHRLQEEILRSLGPLPLAMEQFDVGNQAGIDVAMASGDVEAVAMAGKLAGTSWNWDYYRPLVRIALEGKAPLVAANLSRADARAIVSKGFEALPGADALGIAAAWNAQREAALVREIEVNHCDALPPGLAPGMARAQRARDAVMADRLLRHPRGVLIAGSGHARSDRGVPIYLRQRAPAAKVVSVGMVEEGEDAAARARNFDYAYITPRAPRKDPCEGFRMPQR